MAPRPPSPPRSSIGVLVTIFVALASPAQAGKAAKLRQQFDQARADIVLVGNSMLKAGIDDTLVAETTGRAVFRFYQAGVGSPWKFLVLQNVVAKAAHVPKLVVLVTRENRITRPHLRIDGKYKNSLDELRGSSEPVLDAIAYGLSDGATTGPIPADERGWDFGAAVDRSFLPHIVELAKAKGYRLVVAIHKVSRAAKGSSRYAADRAEQVKYRDDLAAWLTARGGVVLDYTETDAIRISHYKADGGDDHLNERGRKVWSRLLGDDLRALLEGRPARRHRLGRPPEPSPAP